ncbi:MAG: hypothetical protein EPO63_02345 [Candidatus Nitrosotenuis sp.]|nr:MAG: hypothetical protein EPO63_02345 [Candidatus Nitrosotenuis sp.]
MPKQKYLIISSNNVMNPVEMRMFMEMHGYPAGFSLSPFNLTRYPPGANAPFSMNPAKLKEKIIRENETFTVKLHDFNKMYLQHASSLLEMTTKMVPPGHPMYSQAQPDVVEGENEKLRKENAELKSRFEQLAKSKKHN